MLLKNTIKAIAFTLSTASFMANSAVRVIDFDTDSNGNAIIAGQVIDNEYQDFGVTISSCNYNDSDPDSVVEGCSAENSEVGEQTQITYDTVGNTRIDPDLEFIFVDGEYVSRRSREVYDTDGLPDSFSSRTNPGNVLILSEEENESSEDFLTGDAINDQGSRAAGYFTFDFDFAVNLESIDFFDVEDQLNQNIAFYAIQFFDQNGNEILEDEANTIPILEDGEWVRVQYDIMGVFSIRVNLPGSGAIDNLAFSPSELTPPSEVSAPSAVVLLMGAFLLIWRRKRI
ncbi:hypothetical protein J3L16_00010 [Alteromonas sp. 5E99-2]|uniref:hypothetical protein n=1 Tax=Alteromonas sp. 5E99-2 TaxID=2817683 RepID=UPI001A9855F4|nr:hypothetical protein [Alteromonas sp. 5E99-2]MBO1254060.1 hypothetical protein [Alteromonas sp. 5E99-2]